MNIDVKKNIEAIEKELELSHDDILDIIAKRLNKHVSEAYLLTPDTIQAIVNDSDDVYGWEPVDISVSDFLRW